MEMHKKDISVVVPVYNEYESLAELEAWIVRVMSEHGYSYELIFVDDGSSDSSWAEIEALGYEVKETRQGTQVRKRAD